MALHWSWATSVSRGGGSLPHQHCLEYWTPARGKPLSLHFLTQAAGVVEEEEAEAGVGSRRCMESLTHSPCQVPGRLVLEGWAVV